MTDTAANARPFGIRDKIGYALGWLGYQKELGSDQPQQVATDIKRVTCCSCL